jgi:hypothetical protein
MEPLIKNLYAKTGPYLRLFQRFRAQFRVHFRAHRSFRGGLVLIFRAFRASQISTITWIFGRLGITIWTTCPNYILLYAWIIPYLYLLYTSLSTLRNVKYVKCKVYHPYSRVVIEGRTRIAPADLHPESNELAELAKPNCVFFTIRDVAHKKPFCFVCFITYKKRYFIISGVLKQRVTW